MQDKKQNNNDKEEKVQPHPEDPAVQRGKAAIDAQHAIDPKPEEVKKKEEEKDAEQWRNEG
jgi:hypothetical protein